MYPVLRFSRSDKLKIAAFKAHFEEGRPLPISHTPSQHLKSQSHAFHSLNFHDLNLFFRLLVLSRFPPQSNAQCSQESLESLVSPEGSA